MKRQKVKFPIRFKLILVLTIIPVITLTLYLFLAVDLFKKDKIAYVLDASVTTSRAIGAQVRSQVESLVTSMQPILEGYDFQKNQFDRISKSLFLKEPKFLFVVVYEIGGSTGFKKVGFLQKRYSADQYTEMYSESISEVLNQSQKGKLSFVPVGNTSNEVLTGIYYRKPEAQKHWVIVTLSQNAGLADVFGDSDLYMKYLLGPDGKLLYSPITEEGSELEVLAYDLEKMHDHLTPEGSKELVTSSGVQLLSSYANVGIAGLIVASFVKKNAALAAVESLWIKSVLFFIALVSATVIVSVFASQKMTRALRQLYLATRKVADGDFNIHVVETSKDEVGSLAVGFNSMAKEVSRLMDETAEKARMENELKTAQVVQENLMPPLRSQLGPFQIAGFFEPASEIGGDWWHYCEIGSRLFFWIGDATGHGAPAALITSAAKAASAIIECFPQISPGKALYLMNRAIFETSKSKFMMTFFLGSLDKNTGELVYSNASHDPPYLLRDSDQPLKKKDIIFLNEVNNPRLGQVKDSTFKEAKVLLHPGDTVVLYTDGVLDVTNSEGRQWGERRFIKSLFAAMDEKENSEDVIERIRHDAFEFRQETPLDDDFTIFLCHYSKIA